METYMNEMFQLLNMNIIHSLLINMMLISLLKECDKRDAGSEKFLKRIQKVNKYKIFTTKEELLREVKKSLQESIDNKLTHTAFDKDILHNSSIEDVDTEAIDLYLDVLEKDNIRDLFGRRDLDKIFEYIGAGKIDKKITSSLIVTITNSYVYN